jgi:ATP-binding protein involved in chromosome partitioning
VFETSSVEKASKNFNIPFLAKLLIEPKVAKMEDKGTVLLELLENNMEWQKNFEYVVNAVEKILEEK